MEARVSKWGNSLGIRIPSSMAKEIGIGEDDLIELSVQDKRLIVMKAEDYKLEELLSRVNSENFHDEVESGTPEGREFW